MEASLAGAGKPFHVIVVDDITEDVFLALLNGFRFTSPLFRLMVLKVYNWILDQHIKDGTYIDVLKNSLKESAKRVFTVIKALEFHCGYMNRTELPSYMFSAIINLKGHKRADIIIKESIRLNLIINGAEYAK